MANAVILNKLHEKISEIETNDNVIIVLKGIPLEVVDSTVDKIELSKIIDNKMMYFMSIYGNRKFLTYEEFLLMSDFVVAQYKEVYIINNNIYMDQYPVEECFSPDIRAGLLNHYSESEEEDDETTIGDIDEYVSIFEGLKEYNGYLMGAYSRPYILNDNKIINIDLFEIQDQQLPYTEDEDTEFIDLIEESDFIDFVKTLFAEPDELYVRISNYTGERTKLKNHIETVAAYWKDYTDIFFVQAQAFENEFEHREEYSNILKNYWGHPTFKDIDVYDINKLEQGIKEITAISQENIISDIVKQVENCGEGEDFRDIFVTAPTGAGKSVMFQVPAIYLAENYNLLTIVISPLIGLMNDQVKNLELKNYKGAKTINSDISPIIKQDIIEKVADGEYHILYISPETLLSRSDVEQLIGNRTIGMIIIDEAHIVTTWGKQFRPDYWYLGDHIRKLRKKQIENKNRSFVVSTFTATAIYRGVEDMYTETINSLHMLNPITYLGHVKRNKDIEIKINKPDKTAKVRREYEIDNFEKIEEILKRAIITNKKTLIYFPTVALINRCYEYLKNKRKVENVALYYGTLSKDAKQENYEKFYNKEKLVMLATKAFGMGIDINDIEIVAHFAPTGNVCDYVQEIGRAARKKELIGEAVYNYDKRDFKHINRLHGMSTIQPYQLINVLEKIDELYQLSLKGGKRKDFTKKRNAMLLDAENFSYIFKSPVSDEDDNINKVKTALLLIQKDFENKVGFSPIRVRPIPMFSVGFFAIEPYEQKKLLSRYPNAIEEIESTKHICRVLLNQIWNKDYRTHSFPKFKYMIYSRDKEFDFNAKYNLIPALCVSVTFDNEYKSLFVNIWETFKGFIHKKVQSGEHTAVSEITAELSSKCKMNKYKAQAICEVIIASMDSYRKNFARTATPIAQEKTTTAGVTKYQFNVAVNSYFKWVENGLQKIENGTTDGKLYLINDGGNKTKEYGVILGILESMSVLTFEMLGGANSQIYIYINQIQAIKNILNAPYRYNNRLLDTISERHLISVKMLTYLYEGDFDSDELWNLLEDYFLGVIPDKVKLECRKEKPDMIFD